MADKIDIGKRYISKKEVRAYGLAGVGQNMIYGIMSFFVMIFYTDTMGIDPLITGTMLMVARVWDAVNDPMMGTIVDRMNSPKGKFIPFLMITPIPMAICTILLFVNPNFGMSGKIVYMYITYFLWGMVYTISDVPYWGLSSATTPNRLERKEFIGTARAFCAVGAMLPMIGMMGFEMFIDNIQTRFFVAAVAFACVGSMLFYLAPLNVKERVRVNPEGIKFVDNFKMLGKNKPLVLIVIAGAIGGLRMMAQSAGIYVARYNFMDGLSLFGATIQGEATITIILSAGFGGGLLIGTFLTPMLQRKFNYKKLYIYSALLGFAAQFVLYLFGYSNIFIVILFLTIGGFTFGIYNVITYGMIADSIDYLEWRTGKRSEGICFSFQTFMTKLASGLASGVTGIVLSFSHFRQPINEVLQVQSAGTLKWLFALITLIPAIACLLSVIPMFFYDNIGKKQDMILEELRIMREEKGIVFE